MTDHFETRLASLASGLRTGQISLTGYVDQLEAHFSSEQSRRIQAFISEPDRFERVRQEAAALEARYPEPADRPALYGVPVGVKDIYHVDGFHTKAGSQLPASILAGPEADSVARLKQSGALILGKTVTTEFAYFGPGPTRNPHNLEHTPGGSSSGSAAAAAAGLCPLTLGTQTIGSIIRPASFCGCVGFKPSAGRISAEGVIPLSPTLDHVGFFTQDVAGAALVGSILCTDWQNDPITIKRPVLGVPAGPYLDRTGPEGLQHFQTTQEKLKQAGYEVVVVDAMENFDEIVTHHTDLVAGEAALVHQSWFAQFADRYHPKTASLIERGHQISSEQMHVYIDGRDYFRSDLEALMAQHEISAWISPAAIGPAPVGIESTGDPVMNLPWTYAGFPTVNVPSGVASNGLPLGLQVSAGLQEDEALLAWAHHVAEALA